MLRFPFLLIAIIFCFATQLRAQTGFQKLIIHAGPGPVTEDNIRELLINSNNDYVFAGLVRDLIQWNTWGIVYKTDANGELIWTKLYRYNAIVNQITSFKQVADGGYILTGDATDSTGTIVRALIMKIDTAGNVVWSKLNPSTPQQIFFERSTIVGNYYLSGGKINNTPTGLELLFVKFDQHGNIIWSKYLAQSNTNYFYDISGTRDSGCVFMASESNNLYYGRLDSAGNRMWSKRLMIPGYNGNIRETSDGGFIICTYSTNMGFGQSDILLIRTDSLGNVLWGKIFGSLANEIPTKLNILPDERFLITGHVSGINSTVAALRFVVDSSGNFLTANIYSENNISSFHSSSVTDSFNVLVGSYTMYPPNGIKDIYLVKTYISGNSGCYENVYPLSDSSVTYVSTNVSDSVVDYNMSLYDINMLTFDVTANVWDSIFCSGVSVNEIDVQNEYKIFPNPTSGSFTIHSQKSVNGSLLIYNAVGEMVYREMLTDNLHHVVNPKLPAGIYFIQITDPKTRINSTLKLIVQP